MTKVIQIRGVDDTVHASLVAAADRAGKSLTSYLVDELSSIVRRAEAFEHNRLVTERLRAEIGVIEVPEGETLRAIDEGRAERDRLVNESSRTPSA